MKYEVFDWNTGDVLGETADTAYVLTGLTPSTGYSIGVCAVDEAGNKSASEVTIFVTSAQEQTPDVTTVFDDVY